MANQSDRWHDLDAVPCMLGWQHSSEDCRRALHEGRMLHLSGETTNVCNFDCRYCYTVAQTLSTTTEVPGHAYALPGELTVDARLRLIDQAADLGAVTYDLVGAGEPFIDGACLVQVRHARQRGLQPVVFTNGWLIGAGQRGENLARELNELGVTVVIKHHGPQAVHDSLVRRPGAAAHRDRAIEILVKLGFNAERPTRLGLDNIVCRPTLPYIMDSLRWCRRNNVHLVCSSYIPAGRTAAPDENSVTFSELATVIQDCARLNREEFGLEASTRLPFVGCGASCTQTIGLYVTILGEIYGCVGKMTSESYGRVQERSLAEVWADRLPALRASFNGGCPPRVAHYIAHGVDSTEVSKLS